MPAMTPEPPSLPYEPSGGRVIGSVGGGGPGRQSLVIGAAVVAVELVAKAFAAFAPPTALAVVLVGLLGAFWVPLVYLLILPAIVVAIVRGATALRLRVQQAQAAWGIALGVVALAGWLFPLVGWVWLR